MEMTIEQKRAIALAAARRRASEASSYATPEHLGSSHPELPKKPDFGYVKNIPMGALAGATDIGSTLLSPIDYALGYDRKKDLSNFYEQNANPDSLAFGAGRLGTQIAGTAGVGSLLSKGAQALNAAPKLVNALRSGGFNLGSPKSTTLAGKGADVATRMAAGGAVGGMSAGMIDPSSYQTGALLGSIMPPGVQLAGAAGGKVRSGMESAAKSLMNSSLKPTIAAHRSGDAKVAVDTLLNMGISPNEKGALKIHGLLDTNANKVADIIANSNKRINKNDVLGYLNDTRGTFLDQVDPTTDIEAINRVGQNFASHPYFSPADKAGEELKAILERATTGKTQALQAAGKLKTMAAQQGNLAVGDRLPLASSQPEMQPYFNIGFSNKSAISPSANPVAGMPRMPSRYTHNIERVPEGNAGAEDAMLAYQQRKADEDAARIAFSEWQNTVKDTMPIQKAQDVKRGTQQILSKKYGQQGTAEVEASKSLARGLREEIAKAEPAVAPLNETDQKLIQTLDVVERRMLMDLNKNPGGLSLIAPTKTALAAFLADRSANFKALVARALFRSQAMAGNAASKVNDQGLPLLRTLPIAISASP